MLELAPQSADGLIAQAILYLLDRRYDAALSELDRADALAPGRPYIHAMRGYCLRRMGNSYDAQLAESKAARLAGMRGLDKLFPPVEKPVCSLDGRLPPERRTRGQARRGASATASSATGIAASGLQRRLVRSGFASSRTIITMSLIVINVAIYLVEGVLGHDFFNPIADSSTLTALLGPSLERRTRSTITVPSKAC